jgi:hypothetical protein
MDNEKRKEQKRASILLKKETRIDRKRTLRDKKKAIKEGMKENGYT